MFLALAVTSQALWSKSSSSIRLKAANTPAHSELPQPPILTHTWRRDNKTGRRRKDASRRWGITYVFKDGSSLTAWILQAAQINRSLQTLPPSLYSFSLLISQHLASVYFLDDLSLPFYCLFFTSFLHFPSVYLIHFSLLSFLSLSLFSLRGREGWATRLLTGSSSRIWRRKEVGVPFSFLTCHLQVVMAMNNT